MHTVPLTMALLPDTATAGALAFAEDSLFKILHPRLKKYPDAFRQHFVRVLRQRLHKPGLVVRVAVSDDNDEWWDEKVGEEVLGYAVWARSGRKDDWNKDVWGRDRLWKRIERYAASLEIKYFHRLRLDPSADYDAIDYYSAALDKEGTPIDNILKNHEEHMWLNILAIHPKHQRKGVGRKLLQWGTRLADAAHIPIALYASPKGANLYRSVGFQELAMSVVEYNGVKLEDPFMMRWPHGEQKDVHVGEEVSDRRDGKAV